MVCRIQRSRTRRGYSKPHLDKILAMEAVLYCLGFIGHGKNVALIINSIDHLKSIRAMIDDKNIPAGVELVNDYSGRLVFSNNAELRIFPRHMEPLAKSLMGGDIFVARAEDGDPRLRCVEDIMLS